MIKKLTNFFAIIGVLSIIIANTPNMNMPVPTVGVTPGPQWATQINQSLNIVDAHNHAPGAGRQIGVPGINIQADLPINANNINNARSYRLANQSSALVLPGDVRSLYSQNNDLFYNNGSAQSVRITQDNHLAVDSAAGAFGGQYISAGALASYLTVGNKYTFLGPVSSAANVQVSGALNVLNGPDPTLVPGLTVVGNATVGETFSTTGANPRMSFFDSTAATNDFQWSVDAGVMSLNADTNNDNVFDVQNLIWADALNHVAVGGAPATGAAFTVNGMDASIQIGNQATAAYNWYMVSESLSGNRGLSLYSGNFPSGTNRQQVLTTGEVGLNGPAIANIAQTIYSSHDLPVISINYSNTANALDYFHTLRARGTQVSPTGVLSGDNLGGLSMSGGDGVTSSSGDVAMFGLAEQNFTPGNHGSGLYWLTTPINTATPLISLTLQHDGALLPGANGTQLLGDSTFAWGTLYAVDAQLETANIQTLATINAIVPASTTTTVGSMTTTEPSFYYSAGNIASSYFSPTKGFCVPATDGQCLLAALPGSVRLSPGTGGSSVCWYMPASAPYDPDVSLTSIMSGGFIRETSAAAANSFTIQIVKKPSADFPATGLVALSTTTTTTGAGNHTPTITNNGGLYPATIDASIFYFKACCSSNTINDYCDIADFALAFTRSGVIRGINN